MRPSAPIRLAVAAALLLLLAACNQTASAPSGPPGASPPGAAPSRADPPVGAGCAADIGQFQALLATDAESGNLSRTVYGRASADVKQAETVCAAGHEVQGRTLLASAKRNYGYK